MPYNKLANLSMKTLRIFPSKTKATPDDENAIINRLPNATDQADNIKISVTFTWDLPQAEILYNAWKHVAPCEIGGPATGQQGDIFSPGEFLKQGYVITSRGCNNKCWFCSVWKREGNIKELPITDGWIVTDDNLLACSPQHIDAVFEMLKKQPHKPRFTGGLEAKLLTPHWALKLRELKPDTMFFAYDTPDDLEPLIEAAKMLFHVGFTKASHILRAYVLIGYPSDTFDHALNRIHQTWNAGFMPMAMLYRDNQGQTKQEWRQFQRQWANPIITAANCKLIDNKMT